MASSPSTTQRESNRRTSSTNNQWNWRHIALFATAILSFCCFASTLGCYFFCDDFTFLRCAQASNSKLAALPLQILTTPFSQVQPFLSCYRPLPLLIFLGQYVLAGTNPWFYHLWNILLHCFSAVLVFLICEQLCARIPRGSAPVAKNYATLTSFTAATLFAGYPVNSEVVNLPNNMVTGTCVALCLASLLAFLRWHGTGKRRFLWSSLIAFSLSLLSKENAIALPPTLLTYCFLYSDSARFAERTKDALRATSAYWYLSLIYIGVRTAVLGGHFGGYQGAVGASLQSTWQDRLFGDWPLTCLFPINHTSCLPPEATLLTAGIGLVYVTICGSIACSLWKRQFALSFDRRLMFLLGWFLCALATVAPVWNLEPTLGGGRHFYLASAPVMVALAIVCSNTRIRIAQFAALALALCFAFSTTLNNRAWIEAGQMCQRFKSLVEQQITNLKAGEKLVLLNTPYKHKGVYLFSSSQMLRDMLDLDPDGIDHSRVQMLAPWYILNHDLVNVSALRNLQCNPGNRLIFWHAPSDSLQTLAPNCSSGDLELPLVPFDRHIDQSQHLSIEEFRIDPSMLIEDSDFIQCQLRCKRLVHAPLGIQPAISLSWQTFEDQSYDDSRSLYLPVVDDGQWHTYRFAPGRDSGWLSSHHNGNLRICLPSPNFDNDLAQVTLLGWRKLAPAIHVTEATVSIESVPNEDGIIDLNRAACLVHVDASKVPAARWITLDIARAGNLLPSLERHMSPSLFCAYTASGVCRAGTSATIALTKDNLPAPGLYQIQASALDGTGAPIGCYSDSIFLRVPSH